MYHFKLTGSHYQMGFARGIHFRENRLAFPLALDPFQLAHGQKSEKILRNFFPEVCQEIKGVSDAVGAAYLPFASWMLCMGCCMYNLEETIPREVRGCTAFAFSMDDGRVIYGRNNDLPPYLKKWCRSEFCTPLGGRPFSLTTSSFINGEEGINAHGLAVAMTFVMTPLEAIRPGFNSCFAVRYLLEKARNVPEALSLLEALPIASNCNILLADKRGEMAVAECTPAVKRIRKALRISNGKSGKGRLICTVNSFTSDEMKAYNAAQGDDFGSAERYNTVIRCLPAHAGKNLVDAAKRLLRGDYGFMCQYDHIPDFETVWSSVFDLNHLMIYRAEGDPRKNEFVGDAGLAHLARL